jgi:hypothetical protein
MKWRGWRRVSVRKPLAVAAFVWTMSLCTAAFFMARDLPSGVVSVLLALVPSCIVGYAASSAYEAGQGPKKEEEEGNEDE